MAKKHQINLKFDSAASDSLDLVNSLALSDMRMVDGYFSQKIRVGKLPTNVTMSTEVEMAFVDEGRLFRVRPFCSLVLSYSDEKEPNDPPIAIHARYQITYKNSSPEQLFSEESQKFFGQTISLNHIWPYWREYVHSSFFRMGRPPVLVPLLNQSGLTNEEDSPQSSREPKKTRKKSARSKKAKKTTKKRTAKKKRSES